MKDLSLKTIDELNRIFILENKEKTSVTVPVTYDGEALVSSCRQNKTEPECVKNDCQYAMFSEIVPESGDFVSRTGKLSNKISFLKRLCNVNSEKFKRNFSNKY